MKKTHEYKVVDSVETLEEAIAKVRAAQRKYATYTQEQVDRIFLAAATAANTAAYPACQNGRRGNRHGRCGRQGH